MNEILIVLEKFKNELVIIIVALITYLGTNYFTRKTFKDKEVAESKKILAEADNIRTKTDIEFIENQNKQINNMSIKIRGLGLELEYLSRKIDLFQKKISIYESMFSIYRSLNYSLLEENKSLREALGLAKIPDEFFNTQVKLEEMYQVEMSKIEEDLNTIENLREQLKKDNV